jgi:uncharacterized protein (DUF305 family)
MKLIVVATAAFVLGWGVADVSPLHTADAHAGSAHWGSSMMNMMNNPGGKQMHSAMQQMDARMSSMRMTGNQDRDFMVMMVPHHQAAVDMAKTELQYGHKPALKALARNIISSQEKEIGQMRAWLRQWYNE